MGIGQEMNQAVKVISLDYCIVYHFISLVTAINPYETSNESSIIISWDLPCQPRNITRDRMVNNYTIMVTDTATGEYFIVNTTKILVVLSNLNLNTNYSIRIAVFTSKLGPFSDPFYISTHLTGNLPNCYIISILYFMQHQLTQLLI